MQAVSRVDFRRVSIWTVAVLLGVLAVGLELAFHLSLKLPGHRALPGAAALLLFAQLASPLAVVVFAAAVSACLALLPGGDPVLILPWLLLAVVWLLLQRGRARGGFWLLLGLGALFGLARAGMLWGGFHQTPQLVRLAGHIFFGGLGGALSFGAYRLSSPGPRAPTTTVE